MRNLFRVSFRSFQNKNGIGVGLKNEKTNLIDFIDNRPIRAPKVSPKLKSELKKKMPVFTSALDNLD